MPLDNLKIFFRFFLAIVLFQDGFCMECLKLESGDLSDYDVTKCTGRYEYVMGIVGDSSFGYLVLKCNGVTIKQHPHPNGGINVAVMFEDINNDVIDTFLGHLNSSTDIYFTEIDSYHSALDKWVDVYAKVLLATDDLLVYATCVKNEDNEDDDDFTVAVLRREGSSLHISKIKENLPESIRDSSDLEIFCDH